MYLTHNIHRAHDPSQGRGTSLCKDARHASLALSLSTDAMLTYHAIKHAGPPPHLFEDGRHASLAARLAHGTYRGVACCCVDITVALNTKARRRERRIL